MGVETKLAILTKDFYPLFRSPIEKEGKKTLERFLDDPKGVLEEYKYTSFPWGEEYQCIPGCNDCCEEEITKRFPYESSEFTDLKEIWSGFLDKFSLEEEMSEYRRGIGEILNCEPSKEKATFLSLALPLNYHQIKEGDSPIERLSKKAESLLHVDKPKEEHLLIRKCFFFSGYGCSIHDRARLEVCLGACYKQKEVPRERGKINVTAIREGL